MGSNRKVSNYSLLIHARSACREKSNAGEEKHKKGNAASESDSQTHVHFFARHERFIGVSIVLSSSNLDALNYRGLDQRDTFASQWLETLLTRSTQVPHWISATSRRSTAAREQSSPSPPTILSLLIRLRHHMFSGRLYH